ncbi:hypothetical protein M9458_048159, partial [Cirrhinus mrigala]
TMGLNWREAMFRCVEIVLPQSGAPQEPEPSPPSPRCVEQKPDPAADGEPKLAATDEPSTIGAKELRTVLEPHATSDQVRELATELTMEKSAMDSESAEGSSAHCTVPEGELSSVDWILPALPLSSSACPEPSISPEPSICPELSACPEVTMEVVPLSLSLLVLGAALCCVWAAHTVSNPLDHSELPPSLPLLPPLHQSSTSPPLFPGSPSAHPQPTICVVGSPWVCQSPLASWLEDP